MLRLQIMWNYIIKKYFIIKKRLWARFIASRLLLYLSFDSRARQAWSSARVTSGNWCVDDVTFCARTLCSSRRAANRLAQVSSVCALCVSRFSFGESELRARTNYTGATTERHATAVLISVIGPRPDRDRFDRAKGRAKGSKVADSKWLNQTIADCEMRGELSLLHRLYFGL